VTELVIRERPPSTLRNVDDGPTAGPTTATTEAEDIDGSPRVVPAAGLATTTTEAEDVDGGPLRGAGARDLRA
jgi:hypothetical protein